MRNSFVSLPIVLAFLALACTMAQASGGGEQTEFSAWAAEKSSQIDSRWTQVAQRHAPAGGSTAPSEVPATLGPGRAWTPARSAQSDAFTLGRPGAGAQFTGRASGQFLSQSTRNRGGPTRGATKLNRPGEATRAFSGERRQPSVYQGNFPKTIHMNRSSALRPSPSMGSRITGSAVSSRTPSTLRGATRARRTPTRGR